MCCRLSSTGPELEVENSSLCVVQNYVRSDREIQAFD